MTAEELKAKYSGAGGGMPSLLRSQIGGTSASQALNAESLRQKYGVGQKPTSDTGVFNDNFLGNLLRETGLDFLYSGIEVGRGLGLLKPEETEFDTPLFGKYSTKDRTGLQRGMSGANVALTLFGGPILKALGVGGKVAKATKAGQIVAKGAEGKTAQEVVKAVETAARLKKGGVTAESLTGILDEGKVLSPNAPKINKPIFDVDKAGQEVRKNVQKLREYLSNPIPPPKITLDKKQIFDRLAGGKTKPLSTSIRSQIGSLLDDLNAGKFTAQESEDIIKEIAELADEPGLASDLRKMMTSDQVPGGLRPSMDPTRDKLVADLLEGVGDAPSETEEEILKKLLGGTDEYVEGSPPPNWLIEQVKKSIKGPVESADHLSHLQKPGETVEAFLNRMIKEGYLSGGRPNFKPKIPPRPRGILPELAKMSDEDVVKSARFRIEASKAKGAYAKGMSVKDAVRNQVTLDKIDAFTSRMDRQLKLNKILNPGFSDEVVGAARKSVFYKDVVDSALIGSAFGGIAEAKQSDPELADVARGLILGGLAGPAFHSVAGGLSAVGRHVVDPITSRLGNWYRSTKLYDYVTGQASKVLSKLDSAGGAGRRLETAVNNLRTYSTVKETQSLANVVKELADLKTDAHKIAFNARAQSYAKETVSPEAQKLWNSPEVTRALNAWQKTRADWAKEIMKHDFQLITVKPDGTLARRPFQPNPNYLPHYLDAEKIMTPKGFENAKQVLMKTKGMTPEQAEENILQILAGEEMPEQFAQYIKRAGKAVDEKDITEKINKYYKAGSPHRSGSIEFSRTTDLPEEMLITDPALRISRYIKDASRRTTEAEIFGVDNQLLNNMLGTIKNPSEQALAKKIMARILGTDPLDAASATGLFEKLRGIQVFRLGFAGIRNATQTLNTITRGNLTTTAKGLADAFRKQGKDFAFLSGSVSDDVIKEITRGATGTVGRHPVQDWFLRVTGMTPVERMNRTIAANSAKRYALDLERKLLANPSDADVLARFIELDMDPFDILRTNGFIKNIDPVTQVSADPRLLTMANKFVEQSQFKVSPQDLPLFFTSDFGKVVTQFKSFSYKQAQFVKKYVLDEAAHGNLTPLMSYAVGGQFFGEFSQDMISFLRGDTERFDKKGFERMLDNTLAVGGLGLFSDIAKSASQGNYGVTRFILGPTGSDVADIAGRTGTGIATGNFKPLTKYGVSRIPLIGPRASSGIETKADTGFADLPVVGQFLK